MVKQILPAIIFVVFLSSCSAFKSLRFTSNKQISSVNTPAPQAKFIDDITVTPHATVDKTEVRIEPKEPIVTKGPSFEEVIPVKEEATPVKEEQKQVNVFFTSRSSEVESASPVQLKYSVLMNTEIEYLPKKALLENVDQWYGVRYHMGGNTKNGIDCSGFSVAVYAAVYGIALPRVAREQYRISRKISTTELQEGDLLFFHTRGRGVSHVGVYLGNNKFIHASVSKGVMVSDLFETYYIQRFVGAGRIDDKQVIASN